MCFLLLLLTWESLPPQTDPTVQEIGEKVGLLGIDFDYTDALTIRIESLIQCTTQNLLHLPQSLPSIASGKTTCTGARILTFANAIPFCRRYE